MSIEKTVDNKEEKASQKVKSKKENFVYEGPCGSANTQVEYEERM